MLRNKCSVSNCRNVSNIFSRIAYFVTQRENETGVTQERGRLRMCNQRVYIIDHRI